MAEEKRMSITIAIIAILGTTAVVETIVIGVQIHRRDEAQQQHEQVVREVLDEKGTALTELQGRLSTCEAKVTQESIDATGRVLAAAQASDIADTNLKAAVVAAIPLAMYAEAVIATGSPQSISAAAEMAGCRAANTTGDSGRTGCAKEVPERWAAANEALAAYPDCAEPLEGLVSE